jgi:hypothetical protein
LISTEYPTPTLPAGFTYYRLVSIAKTNASADLLRYGQNGNDVTYQSQIAIDSGTTPANWADIDLSAAVPAGALSVTVNYGTYGDSEATDPTPVGIRQNGSSDTTPISYVGPTQYASAFISIPIDENLTVEIYTETDTGWNLTVSGFKFAF